MKRSNFIKLLLSDPLALVFPLKDKFKEIEPQVNNEKLFNDFDKKYDFKSYTEIIEPQSPDENHLIRLKIDDTRLSASWNKFINEVDMSKYHK